MLSTDVLLTRAPLACRGGPRRTLDGELLSPLQCVAFNSQHAPGRGCCCVMLTSVVNVGMCVDVLVLVVVMCDQHWYVPDMCSTRMSWRASGYLRRYVSFSSVLLSTLSTRRDVVAVL